MKILVLGGYGVFGGRLVELLSDLESLDIVVCGRSLEKASAFCSGVVSTGRLTPLRCNRDNIAATLDLVLPDLVVDASGPFQNYGDDPYSVVRACITKRCNYLDFADGSDFVAGIEQFDAEARAVGVYVLSGVSSFPVLTAAVLREMSKTMEITSVTGGIAPSPFAGIGLNVMRAVIGYAGAPVKLLRNGVAATGTGLVETKRYTISVPGHVPLRNILFSLVDVPDLQLIPQEHPDMRDIWMGAGPVPEILHRALNLLARLRAVFRLPSLVPLSGVFYRVLNLIKYGEHRGGMFIDARGQKDGKEISQSWHLLAEGDDGPYIPSMAIEAIIRKSLAGTSPDIGARTALGALEFADYETLFSSRTIYTGFRGGNAQDEPIYRQVLGVAFDELPAPVQKLHDATGARNWSGTAVVERGNGVLATIACRLIGFPKAGQDVPVRVAFRAEGDGERWTREFAGKKFNSLQYPGAGRNAHLLMERFGLATFALALVIKKDKLHLVARSWTFAGIAMPRFMLPTGQTFETAEGESFVFDVDISVPFIGRLVHYRGQLKPDS